MSEAAKVAKKYEERMDEIKANKDLSPLEKSELIMKTMDEFEKEFFPACDRDREELGPMPTFSWFKF